MKKPLIINTPSLQSLRQKYVSTVLTLVFWVVWIFLWTPLLTLLGWLLGLDQVYLQMIELNGFQSVLDDFMLFAKWVGGLGGGLAVWALYNFIRFRNVERRAALPPVTNRELAEFCHVDETTLTTHQHSRCLSVRFDGDGNIVGIDPLHTAKP